MDQDISELPLPPYPEPGVSSYAELSDEYPPPPSPINHPNICRIIPAYRGNLKLIVGHHVFTKTNEQKERVCWRCINRDCSARISTVDGKIIKWHNSSHNHLPVPGQSEVEIMLSDMKERAAKTAEPISHIVDAFYAQVDVGWAHLIPTVEAVKRTLRRERQRAGVRELAPFRTTISGDAFLRYEEDGMVIFASDDDLRFLAQSRHWFGDGTFKVTPVGYAQQYSLHAFHDGVTYPCVYVLLPGKSEQTYRKMMEKIIDLMPSDTPPNPASIMTDFEKAAMNAFQFCFPETEIRGCYFHLGQSAWRRIQSLGLSAKYREEPSFALRVRRLPALAFVPPNEVHRYMTLILADEVSRDDGLLQFVKYFQDTYVGQRVNDTIVIPGQFPHQQWNMYHRVKNNLPRTNNSLEGWHNGFAKTLPIHPEMPVLAAKYQREQHKLAITRQHHLLGRKIPHVRKKYDIINKRLITLVNRLDSGILVDLTYLESVAKMMPMNTEI